MAIRVPCLGQLRVSWWSLGLGALLQVPSCSGGQSGAELSDPGGGDPGGSECTRSQCEEEALADVQRLSQPSALDVEYAGASCSATSVITESELGTVSGSACECALAGGGARTIGPVGLGCYLLGHGGECLWGDDEFGGCNINDPNSCDSVCAELEQRQEADAAKSYPAELVYAACGGESGTGDCQSVVSIDGTCYANRDYDRARGYDCSLGAVSILEQHAEDTRAPEPSLILETATPYLPGTDGMLQLTSAQEYWGTAPGPVSFGAYAQFFDVEGQSGQYGDVLDPLDGVDDCGVTRLGSVGSGANIHLLSVDQATLHEEGRDYALEEFRSSSDSYYAYLFDLSAAGVVPRPLGSYGFSASGGSFAGSIELDGIVLPDTLSLPGLVSTRRLARGALDLTWTGRGQAPLRLLLQIQPTLADIFEPYSVECLMADDGAFTIPASVLDAAPDGTATAYFTRERRRVAESGGKSIQTIASQQVTHRFWLGPACDGSAVMAA
ncbi:MAG TPA: hypothetical protein VJU61_02475, partial [Polyangiaceae bacterium]|nr:hypothetical protein [Polyangiaceae bacterium]